MKEQRNLRHGMNLEPKRPLQMKSETKNCGLIAAVRIYCCISDASPKNPLEHHGIMQVFWLVYLHFLFTFPKATRFQWRQLDCLKQKLHTYSGGTAQDSDLLPS